MGDGYAPIDARDIGRVAAHGLTKPGHEGEAYELTGPQAITHEEVVEALTRMLGRTIRYVRIDDEDYRQSLLAMGLSEGTAEAYIDANRHVRKSPSTVTSIVQDVTGREPTSFEEFCHDHASVLAASS